MKTANLSAPNGEDEMTSVDLVLVPSAHGILGHDIVELAVRLVDAAGVLDKLTAWKAEEVKGPGGRPVTFPTRALLVALVVCALSDQPLHLKRVCDVMFRQLSPTWRQLLEIPDPPPEHDRRAWNARYRNVRTRFHYMVDLVDPSPEPKNRQLDHETFEARAAERHTQLTDDECDERYRSPGVLHQSDPRGQYHLGASRGDPELEGVGGGRRHFGEVTGAGAEAEAPHEVEARRA